MQSFEEANEVLRAAVKDRLDATPKNDPKMIGYPSNIEEVVEDIKWFRQQSGKAQHPSSGRFMELLEEMRQLHTSKSADYGSQEDPLANIRSGADFVSIEPWRGCMVRIADKVQRLRTYCKTGKLVHEGVADTLLDLAAYSLLAIILHEEARDA
jgi:hypothetical protein